MENEKICRRLSALREDAQLSKKELASLLDVSPSRISFYEGGQTQIPSHMIDKIASLFEVSADYLLGRTNIKNSIEYEKVTNQISTSSEVLRILQDLKEFPSLIQEAEQFIKFKKNLLKERRETK